MSDVKFYNETLKRQIDFERLVEELVKYIRAEPEREYKISVGTDSQGSNHTHFVTAIAILRVGNGGIYFWTRSDKIYCPTMQDRIYKEAMRSIVFVQELKSRLREKLGEEFFWDNKISVHIDVGKRGETKDLVDIVIGMVKGYGFDAVIKPDSFGAFVIADRHT
ncbi:MAG: ribonuclease H-like YkuK family protein [Patescibacteria group bacterium]